MLPKEPRQLPNRSHARHRVGAERTLHADIEEKLECTVDTPWCEMQMDSRNDIEDVTKVLLGPSWTVQDFDCCTEGARV